MMHPIGIVVREPLTDRRSPALRRQSHVSPIYYNYPIDLMELASEMVYERIHPKGGPPEWRRGARHPLAWTELAPAGHRVAEGLERQVAGSMAVSRVVSHEPAQSGCTFYKDLLPFGFIEVDGRVPSDHKIVRSNWNSELTSMKLSNRSAQLPIAMLLALTGAAGIWGCFRLRRFVRKSQVRLGVLN